MYKRYIPVLLTIITLLCCTQPVYSLQLHGYPTTSGGSGGSPGGSSSEVQFRSGATTFGGLTGSSISGSTLTVSTLTLTNPLGITYGGTGSNFSATGGSNQVVKQNSSGGALTVGTLASGNLSDTANIPLLNAGNLWTGQHQFTSTPNYNLASGVLAVPLLIPLNAATHTLTANQVFDHIRVSQTDGSDNTFTVGAGAVVSGFRSQLALSASSDANSALYGAAFGASNAGPGTIKAIHAAVSGTGSSTGPIVALLAQLSPVSTSASGTTALQIALTSSGAHDVAIGSIIGSTGDRFLYGYGSRDPVPYGSAAFMAWMATGSSTGADFLRLLNNAGSVIYHVDKAGNSYPQKLTVQDTTDSTSGTTGALIAYGGAAFQKSVFINGNLNIAAANASFFVTGNKVGGNQWFFQTVDADGRFRMYDQSVGGEMFSIAQGTGDAIHTGKVTATQFKDGSNYLLKWDSGNVAVVLKNAADSANVSLVVAGLTTASVAFSSAVYSDSVEVSSSSWRGGNQAINFISTAGASWTSGALGASTDIGLSRQAAGVLQVTAGAGTGGYRDIAVRHYIAGGTAPTVASTSANSCGTTAPTIVGADAFGKVTVGATSGTSCTITFGTAFTNAPSCSATNETTSNLMRPTSTTTTLVIAGTMIGGDKLAYQCGGY